MSEDKFVVLITGASGNLGTATLQLFAKNGAHLALVDLKVEELDKVVEEHGPDRVLVLKGDVTDEEVMKRVVGQVKEHFGQINALVHIAGTFRGGTPVHKTDLSTWDFLMNLNARSVVVMAKAVVPFMLEQGGGSIVTVGSRNVYHVSPSSVAYTASKTAVVKITETLSAELLNQGIRANAVLPSLLDTSENREAMPEADFSQWVHPKSVAEAIFFLTSEKAKDISGASLPVYGRVS